MGMEVMSRSRATERYVAMGLAEKYRKLPRFLRESVIKEGVNRVPTSELKRSRLRSAKRFLQRGLPAEG